MSERAQSTAQSLLSQAIMMRERGDAGWQDSKVVTLPLGGSDGAPVAMPLLAQERDWASAVDLVQEASEAIRIAEQRNGELEAGLHEVLTEATKEIEALKAKLETSATQLAQSQTRAQQAEARAADAERRAAETELWLTRLHDAVIKAFGPIVGRHADGNGQKPAHPTGAAG